MVDIPLLTNSDLYNLECEASQPEVVISQRFALAVVAEIRRLHVRVAELEAELRQRSGGHVGFSNRELTQAHLDLIAWQNKPPALGEVGEVEADA